MEREDIGGLLSSFALGAVAGAAVALLYAPRSGEETRRMMRTKIQRGAEYGRDKLREGADFAREKIEAGALYSRQVADRVAGKTRDLTDDVVEYAEAVAAEVPDLEHRRKPRSV